MKASVRLLAVIVSSLACTVTFATLYIVLRKKISKGDDDDEFSALRRVRSCKDANTYNDVICKSTGKRDNSQVHVDDSGEQPLSGSASAEESPVTQQTSYSSIDTDEDLNGSNNWDENNTESSLSDTDGKETTNRSTLTFCHLSSTFLSQQEESQSRSSTISITDDTSFHQVLSSSVIDTCTADNRVRHSTSSRQELVVQTYKDAVRGPSTAEIKVHDIYDTYNSIVPPLSPNTGKTILNTDKQD